MGNVLGWKNPLILTFYPKFRPGTSKYHLWNYLRLHTQTMVEQAKQASLQSEASWKSDAWKKKFPNMDVLWAFDCIWIWYIYLASGVGKMNDYYPKWWVFSWWFTMVKKVTHHLKHKSKHFAIGRVGGSVWHLLLVLQFGFQSLKVMAEGTEHWFRLLCVYK